MPAPSVSCLTNPAFKPYSIATPVVARRIISSVFILYSYYNFCLTSTCTNVSMMSPTLMSSCDVRLIPHSKFVPTSLTSSLKRLSAASEPVWITIPSRIRRARSVRLTLPSRTIHPATVPTLLMWNVSRTSIVAVTSSLTIGASIPSIAALTSSIAS